jgi:uncharacterized membrane protein
MKKITFLAIISLAFLSCKKKDEVATPTPTPTPTPTTTPTVAAKISYNVNIKPIVVSKCSPCHTSPTSELYSDPLLTDYTSVKNSNDLSLIRINLPVNDTSLVMPPVYVNTPLTAAEIKLFSQWKTDGLLEK